MDVEETFDHIGHFGIYQLGMFVLTALMSVEAALQTLSTIFLHGEQEHWCEIERLSNFSFSQQKNIAIPWNEDNDDYEQCTMFDLNYTDYTDEDLVHWNRSVETSDADIIDCDSWVYEQSVYGQTIVNEWNLVCDKSWILPLSGTIYLSAMLTGCWIGGYLADIFGRKKICFVSCVGWAVFAMVSTFATNEWVYIFLRWMTNTFQSMGFVSSFILIIELVGSSWRVKIGIAFQLGFSVGFVLIPWIAYVVRDFVELQFVIGGPLLIFICYYWVLLESPKWLIVQGRIREAEEIFLYMGQINGRPLPQDYQLRIECEIPKEMESAKATPEKLKFIDLLKSPILRRYTIVVYFLWFTCALVYYGISINTGDMVGSVYWNTFLVGAVEFPGNAIAIIAMDTIGRRNPIACANIVAGVSMIACVPFIGNDDLSWLVITFTLIGKGAMTLSFNAMYVMTAEIFPTSLRNLVLGSASAVARIASASTPYFGEPAMELWEPLPSLIFGIFATLAGVLTFTLPETIGLPLPDTIEQSEAMAKYATQRLVIH